MQSVPLEEAAGRLAELVAALAPGEELVLTRDDRPVAVLKAAPKPDRPRPVLGRAKGMLTILADDDEHLKDFAEYMP